MTRPEAAFLGGEHLLDGDPDPHRARRERPVHLPPPTPSDAGIFRWGWRISGRAGKDRAQQIAGLAAWLPPGLAFEIADDALDGGPKGREIPGHDLPDARVLDPGIVVAQYVVETGDGPPGDVLVPSLEPRRNVARGRVTPGGVMLNGGRPCPSSRGPRTGRVFDQGASAPFPADDAVVVRPLVRQARTHAATLVSA
jgi:hypothetical protein